MDGLVLERTPQGQGQYRRVGTFFSGLGIKIPEGEIDLFEKAKDMDCHADSLECVEILEDNGGNKRSIIDII